MPMRSSWGLAIDLGDEALPADAVEQLYHGFWDQAGDPVFKMGEYGPGLPQAAEGKVTLAEQQGKAYTKFEKDKIGYPPGWEVPTLFSLSLFAFQHNLPENTELAAFALDYLRQCAKTVPFRMAVIGNLGCYYLNAEMINQAWVTLQQQDVHTLVLHESHPLTRQWQGISLGEDLPYTVFSTEYLKNFWQPEVDFETRHRAYKHEISGQLHTPLLPLEWESPNSN
jgi:hypothetical protein